MRLFGLLIAFFFAVTASAKADWNYVPHGSWVAEGPTARGIAGSGVHALLATCVNGTPFIYTSGYASEAGANRTESFSIEVDGVRHTVTGTHAPPDGLWTGTAPSALIAALRQGRRAEVRVPGQRSVRYSLRGSSRALARALAACSSPGSAASAGSSDPATSEVGGDVIAAACSGGYTLAKGSELQGDLDGDGQVDKVLDWAGVACGDRSKGRGAGFCGINMCRIDVMLSSTGVRQEILGVSPSLTSRAFGGVALRTFALRPSCPEGALECQIDWRWTGTELEPAR